MSATDEPSPLSTVGERYVLVERLDADAAVERWRGHDDLAGRKVIVRRFLDADDAWRDGFRRRAGQLSALSIPGVTSVLAYDADDAVPWLVETYVDGHPASALTTDTAVTTDDALAIVGQATLALATMHDAGAGHGSVSAEHVIVRPDGSVALTEPVMTANPALAEDRAALARLARALCTPADSPVPGPPVTGLVARLDRSDGSDLADLGRTALALASAQRTGASTPASIATARTDPDAAPAPEPSRPRYDDDERKRVRNRLIALGAIVVIGGAALLRIFSSGAGQTTVPSVIGLPYVEAQHQLNEVGLRVSATFTTGPLETQGTVRFEDPQGGSRVKVGTLVHLTVVTSSG